MCFTYSQMGKFVSSHSSYGFSSTAYRERLRRLRSRSQRIEHQRCSRLHRCREDLRSSRSNPPPSPLLVSLHPPPPPQRTPPHFTSTPPTNGPIPTPAL